MPAVIGLLLALGLRARCDALRVAQHVAMLAMPLLKAGHHCILAGGPDRAGNGEGEAKIHDDAQNGNPAEALA